MHAVVMDSLEEYLSGALGTAHRRQLEAHLADCDMCRDQIRGMREVSELFASLRSEEVWEPSPGLYAGAMRLAEAQRATPVFAGFFSMDLGFARRLAFACLLTLAVLGGFLATREARYPSAPSPEAILAEQNSPAFDSAPAEENMLVTLTAYEQR